jgi:hypothetical protein
MSSLTSYALAKTEKQHERLKPIVRSIPTIFGGKDRS